MDVIDRRVNDTVKDSITDEYIKIFNGMDNPVGFTFNLHPIISQKNDSRKYVKRRLSAPDIDNLWNIFSSNLRHAHTFSYERKMKENKFISFAAVQFGRKTGQPHLHGVVDNIFSTDKRMFRWVLNQCLKNSSMLDNFISGVPDYNFNVDAGWVRYLNRENYNYALIAKV